MTYDPQYFSSHISGWHQASSPLISRFIRSALAHRSELRILDFGCGDGFYGPLLREWSSYLVGIDASEAAVAAARARGVYDELRVASGDDAATLAASPLRGSFDAVFTTEVIEHIPDFEQALALCHDALRPGGMLLLTTTMYYHLIFHAIMADRTALANGGLRDYLLGFASSDARARFVRRLWDYTGGHHHGFSRRQLVAALRRRSFTVHSFDWMFAGELVPTFMYRGERGRLFESGPALRALARLTVGAIRAFNAIAPRLPIQGPNCLVIAVRE